jgi:hypothetical protein
MLIATLDGEGHGRKLVDFSVKVLMGKIAGTMLAIYLVFKYLDTWGWITGILPRSGLTFIRCIYGVAYGKWLLYSELGRFRPDSLLSCCLTQDPQYSVESCTPQHHGWHWGRSSTATS